MPAAVILFFALAAVAQTPVNLVTPPSLAKGVAALPRISNPAPAGIRINAALGREDLRARKQVAACSDPPMYWKREVEVTMQGPALLSFLVKDSADCGGVHPFHEIFPLVYDLRTGEAVDWEKVFGSRNAKQLTIGLDDGTYVAGVTSRSLQAIYIARYKNQPVCSVDVISESSQFVLFPNAKARALEIFPLPLPAVARDCAKPIGLDETTLQSLGVSKAWRNALLGRDN